MPSQILTWPEIQNVCMANEKNILAMLTFQRLPGCLSADNHASFWFYFLFPVLPTQSKTLWADKYPPLSYAGQMPFSVSNTNPVIIDDFLPVVYYGTLNNRWWCSWTSSSVLDESGNSPVIFLGSLNHMYFGAPCASFPFSQKLLDISSSSMLGVSFGYSGRFYLSGSLRSSW